MADAAGGLTFVLDECLGGRRVLEILRLARLAPVGRITNLAELGLDAGAADEAWMPRLGAQGAYAVVTRDGEILRASVRLDAWKSSELTLMLLDGRWGGMPIHELARGLIYWWPLIVAHAEAAKAGTAWTVPPNIPQPQKEIRMVSPHVPRSGRRNGRP